MFHELTLCIVGEDRLLVMLNHITAAFRGRYKEKAAEVMKEYINEATFEDHRTPLHMATQNARMVLTS